MEKITNNRLGLIINSVLFRGAISGGSVPVDAFPDPVDGPHLPLFFQLEEILPSTLSQLNH